jgi:hypothetical protein
VSTLSVPQPGAPQPGAPQPAARAWTGRWGNVWARARPVERASYLVGAVLLSSGAFHVGVFAVDGGPWEGPVSWRKAITFGVSFGLTLIAVTWVSSYLRLGDRARVGLLAVFAIDSVVEVAGITVQAWRHVPSHFNRETAVDSAISTVLAVGGGVLIAVLVTLAVAAFHGDPQLPASMRLALRTGFATLLVGLASGVAMIVRGVILVNTGHQQLAYQLGGFLKPLHAVSLHGVLVLPVLAWLLGHTRHSENVRTRLVAGASIAYGTAILATLVYCLVSL